VTEGRTPPARRLAGAVEAELSPSRVDPPSGTTSADRPGLSQGATDDDPFARLRPLEVAPTRRPPRLVALAAGVVGIALLTWGVLGIGTNGGSPPRLAAPTVTTGSAAPATSATSATSTSPPVGGPALVAHRGVLVVGGRHYLVGTRDDEAIAADWGCRGTTQVVLLRPGTGELFVFAAWARAGHDVRASPAGRVPRGSRLSSSTDPAGCAVARSIAPDGATRRVRVGGT
jgi:hypothetical protein